MHWARCLSRRTEKGRAYGGDGGPFLHQDEEAFD